MPPHCAAPPPLHATHDVAAAVRAGFLPSLAAVYSQDLTLLACTESYAAARDLDPGVLVGLTAAEVMGREELGQIGSRLARSVAGATEHVTLRHLDRAGWPRRQHLTLVPYVVGGVQIGVAILTEHPDSGTTPH